MSENIDEPIAAKVERFAFIDLARVVAIIAMVIIHGYSQMGSKAVNSSVLAGILNVLFSPIAAPAFMFLMGLCMQLSTRLKFRDGMYRGILILCLAYLLNILRGWLPVKVGLDLGWYTLADMAPLTPLSYLMEIDILHFAGLSILLLTVLKKLVPLPPVWLLCAIVVLAVGPSLYGVTSENNVFNYLLSLLWGTQRYVYFPLIPWLFFPLVGMFYGSLLKRTDDIGGFFLKSVITGGLLIVFTIPVTIIYKNGITWNGWFGGEFRDGVLPWYILLLFTGIHCMWMPACHVAAKKIALYGSTKHLYGWSRQITAFYIVQWIIIGWLLLFFNTLGWGGVIVCIAITLFFTDRVLHFITLAQPAKLSPTASGVTESS
jgi:uncharacterized membrane protein